jgi:threonine dehydrogenase-like Zn-dependent dehydrogenase
MSGYASYRQSIDVPEQTLRWHLYGAGLDNLGHEGRPEQVPTPVPGNRQLLVRMDAVGICYSDVKIVRLGENHPRLAGRDLKRNPVIMGHEVACTVMRVGDELQDRFQPGQRFVIQADVFYQGRSMAMGYVLEGGFTQYGLITEPMIEGDEGCYLLPNSPDLAYAEGALVEPWACVVASYQIKPRPAPKPGGRWLVLVESGTSVEYRFSELETLASGNGSGIVLFAGAKGLLREQLSAAASRLGMRVQELPDDWAFSAGTTADAWGELQKYTHNEGFDDVVLLGNLPVETTQHALDSLARGGHFVFSRHRALPSLEVDIGQIHYDQKVLMGTTGWDASDAYRYTRGSALVPGGRMLLLGAGGPMGQMQLHYALNRQETPAHIVAVDRHEERIGALREQFAGLAESKGVKLTCYNAANRPPDYQAEDWMALTDHYGYDDIMCLSSSPDAVLRVYPLLTDRGVLNMFAGIPRGTRLSLDLTPLATRHVRLLGSSGSSLADMRFCLEQTESGVLPTRRVLSAIGGMSTVREGIAAMQAHRFPGKIVIFPHLPDLPLMGLPELAIHLPEVFEKLENGRFWTREAEEVLFQSRGSGD